MISIINKIYNIVFKLVFKLTINVLATDILDSNLVFKRLIETNLEYK